MFLYVECDDALSGGSVGFGNHHALGTMRRLRFSLIL